MFKPIEKWEILTPSGWSNFSGIMNNGIKKTYSIYLENGEVITATKEHKFFINNFHISVEDLLPGNSLDGVGGPIIITDIKEYKDEEVFDIIETHKHQFFVNSVISKNCDEFAFVPNQLADEFWASNLPTISTGGRCIIVSTPNGTGNLFYQLWKDANDGNLDFPFKPFKVDWREVPGRDEKWECEMRLMIGDQRFNQEFNCQFQGSSITLIDANFIINKLKKDEPIMRPDDFTSMWKQSEPNHKYVISCDVGGGVGSDFTILNVFDITYFHQGLPADQVAMWRCNGVPPNKMPEYILNSARYWNNAYVIVEVNAGGYGDDIVKKLFDEHAYEYLFFDIDRKEYGVLATKTTKPKAAQWFKDDLEGGKILLHDKQTIDEIGYFEEVKENVFKAKAGRNLTDDCVMSCLWLSYFLHSPYFEGEMDTWSDKEIKKRSLEEWVNKRGMTPTEVEPEDMISEEDELKQTITNIMMEEQEDLNDPDNWLFNDEMKRARRLKGL